LGYGSASLGLLDQQQQLGDGAGGAAEELQPDDVLPLTHTQLQAKVSLLCPVTMHTLCVHADNPD
jgi:hypothetical protein